jgi:hypothetical protein
MGEYTHSHYCTRLKGDPLLNRLNHTLAATPLITSYIGNEPRLMKSAKRDRTLFAAVKASLDREMMMPVHTAKSILT